VLQSRLQFGAAVKQGAEDRFTNSAPLSFLEPEQVREVKQQYLPTATPTPTPTVTPKVTPTPVTRVRPTPPATTRTRAVGAEEEGAEPSRVRPQRPVGPAVRPTAPPVDQSSPYGVRKPSSSGGSTTGAGVRTVSPEASLDPWWRKMPEWILAFV